MKALCVAGLLALLPLSGVVQAQTRYVSDQLVITFRTGPGSQFSIIRNLNSGDRVEVLESLPEEGYSRVRLPDGTEGWVLTQYLQAEATAGLRLASATRELNAERERVEDLQRRFDELTEDYARAIAALEASRADSEAMNTELADIRSASAGALQMREENQELRLKIDDLTADVQVAAMEIDELKRRERQNWFIIGAAVLLGGIIVGLVAPSLRPKRKSSW